MERRRRSSRTRRLSKVPVLAGALALGVTACGGELVDTLPDAVARDVVILSGLPVDVVCGPADGTGEGDGERSGGTPASGGSAGSRLTGSEGERFTCEATSAELDGTLTIDGTFTLRGEAYTSRITGGTGELGERAGFPTAPAGPGSETREGTSAGTSAGTDDEVDT